MKAKVIFLSDYLHMSEKSCTFASQTQNDNTKLTIMEDVTLRIPSADVALVMQFASRMGWTIDNHRSVVSRFIDACRKNASDLTEDEIQAEVNAVRYKG